MFTGIVQAVGRLESISAADLVVAWVPAFDQEGLQLGESIAVNGTCLTVARLDGSLHFDVSPETLDRSSLGDLRPGDAVNLERAMLALGRFGGHIVQGHVDATGTFLSRRREGEFEVLRFQVPPEYDRFLIDKGSIAIDGVSLTVVEPCDGAFDVWAVPHTLDNTNLGSLAEGARVNLEFDVLAKYVEKLIVSRLGIGLAELGAQEPKSLPSKD